MGGKQRGLYHCGQAKSELPRDSVTEATGRVSVRGFGEKAAGGINLTAVSVYLLFEPNRMPEGQNTDEQKLRAQAQALRQLGI